MTWEWAFLIAAFMVCASVLGVVQIVFIEADKAADEFEELKKAVEKVVNVQNTITVDMQKVMSNHVNIEKMAEDTKSLLSKGNLAAAFAPRSQSRGA